MNSEFSELTLADLYSKSLLDFSDRPAFSLLKKESLTYKEFGVKVDSLVEVLNSRGIPEGEKIAILGGNMPNWAVSYFATTISSRVAVPLLPDFTAFEIVNILEHCEAKVLIVAKKLLYKIPDHIKGRLSMLIIMDTLEIQKDIHEAKLVIPKSPDPLNLASIIYTSGTSGASKGVMLSHKNLVAASVMIQELFPVNSKDIFLSILPLSHAYECSLGMILPFTQGSSVVYLDGAPTPSLLLPALKEVRPTIILSVPLIVEKIYKNKVRPIFTKNLFMQILYTLPHVRRIFHKMAGKKLVQMFGGRLRFFGIGGSKLDGVVERFLADSGFPYAIGYGLTETSPLLAGAVPGGVKWQSTGPKLKRVEMKILNPNNKNIGEIVVKGDNVMMGYYKDLDTTATCFTNDGWFRTKDLGMIDKVGNLFIKGRLDNMIVGPNGENIYPEEIEAIINEHDLVLESLVAQIKGKLIAKVHFNYEQIEALHQLYENAEESLTEKVEKVKKELKDYVNDRVNKASKIIEIIEQQVPFEKTATQKIKRYLYN